MSEGEAFLFIMFLLSTTIIAVVSVFYLRDLETQLISFGGLALISFLIGVVIRNQLLKEAFYLWTGCLLFIFVANLGITRLAEKFKSWEEKKKIEKRKKI